MREKRGKRERREKEGWGDRMSGPGFIHPVDVGGVIHSYPILSDATAETDITIMVLLEYVRRCMAATRSRLRYQSACH